MIILVLNPLPWNNTFNESKSSCTGFDDVFSPTWIILSVMGCKISTVGKKELYFKKASSMYRKKVKENDTRASFDLCGCYGNANVTQTS